MHWKKVRINKSYARSTYTGVRTVVDMGTLCWPEGREVIEHPDEYKVGVAWFSGFPPRGRKKIHYTALSSFARAVGHEVTEWIYF